MVDLLHWDSVFFKVFSCPNRLVIRITATRCNLGFVLLLRLRQETFLGFRVLQYAATEENIGFWDFWRRLAIEIDHQILINRIDTAAQERIFRRVFTLLSAIFANLFVACQVFLSDCISSQAQSSACFWIFALWSHFERSFWYNGGRLTAIGAASVDTFTKLNVLL